jgi:hypothetical protein
MVVALVEQSVMRDVSFEILSVQALGFLAPAAHDYSHKWSRDKYS